MFYCMGSLDEQVFAKPPAEGDQSVEETEEMKEKKVADRVENASIYFGKVYADPIQLSQLH